jgi:hypothetical protein
MGSNKIPTQLPKSKGISSCTSSKETWDTLERCHASGVKVKKMKLQALRRQYEHIDMEEQEKIEDFFNRVRVVTNLIA